MSYKNSHSRDIFVVDLKAPAKNDSEMLWKIMEDHRLDLVGGLAEDLMFATNWPFRPLQIQLPSESHHSSARQLGKVKWVQQKISGQPL